MLIRVILLFFLFFAIEVDAKNCNERLIYNFLDLVNNSKNISKSVSASKRYLHFFSFEGKELNNYINVYEEETLATFNLIKYRLSLLPILASVNEAELVGVKDETNKEVAITFKVTRDIQGKGENFAWIKYLILLYDLESKKINDIKASMEPHIESSKKGELFNNVCQTFS